MTTKPPADKPVKNPPEQPAAPVADNIHTFLVPACPKCQSTNGHVQLIFSWVKFALIMAVGAAWGFWSNSSHHLDFATWCIWLVIWLIIALSVGHLYGRNDRAYWICDDCGNKSAVTRAQLAGLMAMNKIPHCPACGSRNIQIAGENKGFSLNKAIVGNWIAGRNGYLAGFMGKNRGKIMWICMDCGNRWET